MSSTKKNRATKDIGWDHGEMIDNNRMWTKCKYCDKEMRGSGVSRLKQHIAGGFPNVEKCTKCPVDISRLMREHLDIQKKENEEVLAEKRALRETLMEPVRRRHGITVDLDDEDSSEDGISVRASNRLKSSRSKDKSCLNAKKGKGLDISEVDSLLYRRPDCFQKKISNMYKGSGAFESAKYAIGKWFLYSNIPPNAANSCSNPYYQAMIDEIARAGVGVIGPTPYEITGPILDAEIEEIRTYVDSFKKKWETYGVTIMCDGWSSTTRLSLINFLIYCDGKTVFHKSVDASSHDKDANYIYELMDDVVEEIGEKYVVQVITDNGSAYKKAGQLLMRKRKHLYWTPCAAHCIDLILEEFAGRKKIKEVIDTSKKISNFIYNHSKVLEIMRRYTSGRELIRPGATRFATNYIAIKSILKQKSNLQKMFTSDDWNKNAASRDPNGKMLQDNILSNAFWEKAQLVCHVHEPVSKVLKIVDGEKQATMGYVYEGMRRAKMGIDALIPRSSKKYCDIIDTRMNKQMMMDIHYAAYYLNPAFHYKLDLSHKEHLLQALKRVVQRIESDEEVVSNALTEGKFFREAMYGFSDAAAIRGRNGSDPAEWWYIYGSDAPNLRKVALKILSQTASSSGCERNWSTFSLIHTKVRNRLNYNKIERLVYVHYNMRLKLRHLMKDRKKVDDDYKPIDVTHIFDEDSVLSEWLDNPGDPLLNELDDNTSESRPNTFLATWAERLSGEPSEEVLPRPRVHANITTDEEFEAMMRGPRQSHGAETGNLMFNNQIANEVSKDKELPQDYQGLYFTEEQYFDHATQDEDHGSRRSRSYANMNNTP